MLGGLGDCHKLHERMCHGAKCAAWFHEDVCLEFLESPWDLLELHDLSFIAPNTLFSSQFPDLCAGVPNTPLLDGCGHARVWHRGRCLLYLLRESPVCVCSCPPVTN